MAEGSSGVAIACGGCDGKEVTHFCQDCKLSLCLPCRKSHQRFLPKHSVVKTDARNSLANAPRESFCNIHTHQRLSKVCEECLIIFCELCGGHDNHKVFTIQQDGSGVALKQMCNNGIEMFVKMIEGFQRVGLSTNLDEADYEQVIRDLQYWCAASTSALQVSFRRRWEHFEEEKALIEKNMWMYKGYSIFKNEKLMVDHDDYGDDLNRLLNGRTVGVKISGGKLEFLLDGQSQGQISDHIAGQVYVVIQIGGHADSVQIVNKAGQIASMTASASRKSLKHIDTMEFHSQHGEGVSRIDKYSAKYEKPVAGHTLITADRLRMGVPFEIRIQVDWTPPHMKRTPFAIGVTSINPENWDFRKDFI